MRPPFTVKNLLKVNTSEALSEFFPQIKTAKGWDKFAEEFNRPEHQRERNKAIKACIPNKDGEELQALRRHCDIVQSDELALQVGPNSHLSHADAMRARIAAGVAIAKHLEQILNGKGDWERKLGLMEQAGRNHSYADNRCCTDCMLALLEFIHREGNLPSKKSLNLEAGRLLNSLEVEADNPNPQYGSILKITGIKHYVYGVREKFDFRTERIKKVCRVVPDNAWKNPKWDPSDFSGYIRQAGLGCLPKSKANELGT